MTAAARRKGYRFENDVCNMLRDELGSVVDAPIRRVLDQYREGNLGDIVLDPFVIECKRYACKFEAPAAWWNQAWKAGEHMQLCPILIWKFDRRPIQAMVPLNLLSTDYPRVENYTAQVSWDTLMMIMRESIVDTA